MRFCLSAGVRHNLNPYTGEEKAMRKCVLGFKIILTIVFIGLAMPALIFAQADSKSDDFHHWFEKGALFSVYGNQNAAIDAFQKAIAIEPENSSAYFNLGIAYAEKEDYQKAIEAVNRAIGIDSGNAGYYYGRGWVHVRFGHDDLGLSDMQRAAEMHNKDAKKYLEEIAPRHAGR
jgi:tetratricopeptide (TPR) repeat protein